MTWESSNNSGAKDEFVDEYATGGGDGGDYGGGDVQMYEDNGFDSRFEGDNGGDVGGTGDDNCRNCGQAGHFARECTEPRKSMGACFNCGQEGHSKADCTAPRVFKGKCKTCDVEGHLAKDCPDKPPETCKNCLQEGHETKDCTDKRAFNLTRIADKTPEEAIAMMKTASDAMDMDDFRDAVKVYSKAMPLANYAAIEKVCRDRGFKVYLIGLTKETSKSWAIIDLQGKLDCEFVIGYYFSPKAQRANLTDRWPSSPEENLERLSNCGIPNDRRVMVCSTCGELGHGSKACTEEAPTIERVEVKCANCQETGHRVRDCPVARKDRFACRNCGQPGHQASDCTEPRSAEGVECKRCNEVGHFAKDCPNSAPRTCRNCGEEGHNAKECERPRNPATVTCRNCDETGHFSKECPKPRDYSRVTCRNCGETGHTPVRCKKPPKEESGGNGDGGFDNSAGADGNTGSLDNFGGFDNSGGNGKGDDWNAAGDSGPVQPSGNW